jgi:hypothetical protein
MLCRHECVPGPTCEHMHTIYFLHAGVCLGRDATGLLNRYGVLSMV